MLRKSLQYTSVHYTRREAQQATRTHAGTAETCVKWRRGRIAEDTAATTTRLTAVRDKLLAQLNIKNHF